MESLGKFPFKTAQEGLGRGSSLSPASSAQILPGHSCPKVKALGRGGGVGFCNGRSFPQLGFSHSTAQTPAPGCCCSPCANPTSPELPNIWKPFLCHSHEQDLQPAELLRWAKQKLPLLLSLDILPAFPSSQPQTVSQSVTRRASS